MDGDDIVFSCRNVRSKQVGQEVAWRQDAARAAIVARNPQQRLVRPEEVANAALWLCMPGAEAITGQAIAVAGGELL